MRLPLSALLSLALLGLTAPSLARADGPDKVSIYESEDWIAARIAASKRGEREILQIPIVTRSFGWGSMAPRHYLGESPDTFGPGPWLAPSGAELPSVSDESGGVALVEGYFTGTTTKEDLRNADGEPEEWLYTLHDFEVIAARPLKDSDDDLMLHRLLWGAAARDDAPPFSDDRPHLVIVKSITHRGDSLAKGQQRAAKEVQTLKDAGFADATSFDSRRASALACCFETVIAGRFATEAEAVTLRKALDAKKIKAYVKKGW